MQAYLNTGTVEIAPTNTHPREYKQPTNPDLNTQGNSGRYSGRYTICGYSNPQRTPAYAILRDTGMKNPHLLEFPGIMKNVPAELCF